MTASSVYNIVDAIFIGQGVGKEGIMGLALTVPIMSLTAAFGAMVGVGGSTLMSVRLGQKDYETARRILGNVVLMNISMGLVLGAVLLLFIDPILRFFGASDATLPYAREFMTVILAGNVVTHLYLGLNAMLRSTNRPMKAMAATIGTVVLNCVFAPIFIFVFDWGIRGAALATILAQVIMLLWQVRLFTDRREFIRLSWDIMHFRRRIVRESLVIGLPQFLMNLCSCTVVISVTRGMAEYGGDIAVGAYGIVNRLVLFVIMVVIGLNQGMQPIAGYNFGARRYDRLIGVLKHASLAATAFTTLGFVIGMFFATPCVSLFAKDAPDLISEAARGLRIVVVLYPVIGLQIVSTAFFQSIGKASISIFLSLTRQLLFLLPGLYLLPLVFSNRVDGVWAAFPVADAAAAVLSIVLVTNYVKKLRRESADTPAAQ